MDLKESHKKELSSDAKIILALLKRQPQKFDQLYGSAGIHRSTLYRILPLLKSEGIIKETEKGYVLFDYIELEERVEKVIKKYAEGYEQIALSDIANEVGKPPKKIEDYAYHLAKKYEVKIGPKSIRRQIYPPAIH